MSSEHALSNEPSDVYDPVPAAKQPSRDSRKQRKKSKATLEEAAEAAAPQSRRLWSAGSFLSILIYHKFNKLCHNDYVYPSDDYDITSST